MNYIVATTKSWNIENFKLLKMNDKVNHWFLITNKENLTLEKIRKIKPRYIFFPHWSWFIPKEIYKNFECIVFHMTDLPYGRGGSPLQNLIVRDLKQTKISAIRVGSGLDTGPIYFKRKLNLSGSAEVIFNRASKIIFANMVTMTKRHFSAKPQKGKVTTFIRRRPEESDISNLQSLEQIYNYIRMLDAEGYPNAFLEKGNIRLEFKNAKLNNGHLSALVGCFLIKK
jgi:methionyl-tRNA formyltransferase